VRENEISLRKLSGGTAQLRTLGGRLVRTMAEENQKTSLQVISLMHV